MICATLGLTPDFGQYAAYIESWPRALKDDKRLIFLAATEAPKAVDLLMQTAPRHCRGKGPRMSGPTTLPRHWETHLYGYAYFCASLAIIRDGPCTGGGSALIIAARMACVVVVQP
ncbi:MAG: zincin-like metallopeptidase domain-containing protein [Paracoccus sp. (in: a-proteobacteria)]|nr:zincin-like metallopeptidase domain-containing protein [Paracoccus sp. (in: a-proteobacteria)]